MLDRLYGAVRLNARRNYGRRVEARFSRAEDAIIDDIHSMMAEHSAKGLLRSGATLIKATEIWERRTRIAVNAALTEFAAIIQTRGREWKLAMHEVISILNNFHNGSVQLLSESLGAVSPRGGMEGGAMKAVQERLEVFSNSIAEDAIAWRDGWTAPVAKGWHERHPVIYGLVMAIVGALLTLITQALDK